MVDVSSVAAQAPALGPKYSQPSQGGGWSPADINQALLNRGIPLDHAKILTAATGAESGFGRSQVGTVNSNGSRDFGLGQINNKAWPDLNPPSLVGASLDKQADAIAHVYNHQGLKAWATYNSGAYKKYLNQVDSTTPVKGTQAGAIHTAPAPTPSAAQQAQQQPFDMGAALAALNATGGGGQGQQQAAGGGGEEAPDASGQLQLQMAAAGGNARQAQIAGQAAQLAAALRQQGAQPLTWGPRPYGSNAGPQGGMPPGVTLNTLNMEDANV